MCDERGRGWLQGAGPRAGWRAGWVGGGHFVSFRFVVLFKPFFIISFRLVSFSFCLVSLRFK